MMMTTSKMMMNHPVCAAAVMVQDGQSKLQGDNARLRSELKQLRAKALAVYSQHRALIIHAAEMTNRWAAVATCL